MGEHTAELDHDTMRLLAAGDCATLAMDVATCRELLVEQSEKATGEINALLAERDRLKELNAELVKALEETDVALTYLAEISGVWDKCSAVELCGNAACQEIGCLCLKRDTNRAVLAKAMKGPDDG